MTPLKLKWQSQLVLLLVLPAAAIDAALQAESWAILSSSVVAWTIVLCGALGLFAWATRSGTRWAAFTGAVLTVSLMFSTAGLPFTPWRTALTPVLAFLILTSVATRYGHNKKERLGTAEQRRGRDAVQVAANLGIAALASMPASRSWLADVVSLHATAMAPAFTVGLAALAEAAADTLSSEIGQVVGGTPRLLTTLRPVLPGTDGGITLAGTVAGVIGAGVVAALGTVALEGRAAMLAISWAGGVFGLFFDSLLGATLERRGLLNNDWVNFASTAAAAVLAVVLLSSIHFG